MQKGKMFSVATISMYLPLPFLSLTKKRNKNKKPLPIVGSTGFNGMVFSNATVTEVMVGDRVGRQVE
jgi:hypothetical protein